MTTAVSDYDEYLEEMEGLKRFAEKEGRPLNEFDLRNIRVAITSNQTLELVFGKRSLVAYATYYVDPTLASQWLLEVDRILWLWRRADDYPLRRFEQMDRYLCNEEEYF